MPRFFYGYEQKGEPGSGTRETPGPGFSLICVMEADSKKQALEWGYRVLGDYAQAHFQFAKSYAGGSKLSEGIRRGEILGEVDIDEYLRDHPECARCTVGELPVWIETWKDDSSSGCHVVTNPAQVDRVVQRRLPPSRNAGRFRIRLIVLLYAVVILAAELSITNLWGSFVHPPLTYFLALIVFGCIAGVITRGRYVVPAILGYISGGFGVLFCLSLFMKLVSSFDPPVTTMGVIRFVGFVGALLGIPVYSAAKRFQDQILKTD